MDSKEIKKTVLGLSLSDGHIQERGRFDFYSSKEEFAQHVYRVLSGIHGIKARYRVKHDKRGYIGYRVWTNTHVYFKKMYKYIYNGRKELNTYSVSRIDEQALAYIWMSDGMLVHAKKKKKGTVQNIGYICFEAFPERELCILQKHIKEKFGIETTLAKVKWGFGKRIRIGGVNLQRFISLVYPHILDCFLYKTPLFYMNKSRVDMSLPNAEQYINEYKCIEDIVRHPLKKGKM